MIGHMTSRRLSIKPFYKRRCMNKHRMMHAGITIVFITYIPRGHVGLLLAG